MTTCEYTQSQEVLWAVSIIAQDESGNTTERGLRILATNIMEALEGGKLSAMRMAQDEEWYQWMIYDVGIVPDNCFN